MCFVVVDFHFKDVQFQFQMHDTNFDSWTNRPWPFLEMLGGKVSSLKDLNGLIFPTLISCNPRTSPSEMSSIIRTKMGFDHHT
jgi:hypothetical protein